MGKSIASLAFEGARDLLKFGGKGLTAGVKGSGKILEYSQASKVMVNHPFRTISSVGALGASVGLAGFGGVGPMSSLGDWYTKNMIAEYGDRPETMKTITATQTSATLVAIGAGLLGGAGLFGFGPLGKDWTKLPKLEGNLGKVKGFAKGLLSSKTPEEFQNIKMAKWSKSNRSIFDYKYNHPSSPEFAAGRKKALKLSKAQYKTLGSSSLQQGYTAGYNLKNDFIKTVKNARMPKMNWSKVSAPVSKHPILWGTGLGFAAGAGIATADDNYERLRGGSEGDITGIGSTPQGGISPELQFSTYDLMFALHRNNKSIKTRYQ